MLSKKEVLNLKLSSIPKENLIELAKMLGFSGSGSATEIIKRILEDQRLEDQVIDEFIKQKYIERIKERQKIISDDDLKDELMKVKTFSWGVVQGQLDQKIQAQYIRKIFRYDDLVSRIKEKLYDELTNYVVCMWFNHWTTVLIEDQISTHNKVIPTIKNIKGIDIFFDGQPFDLKVTYLPREYNPLDAIKNPIELAKWMYENQGSQRFGAHNRLFVILLDKNNPTRSWELKRDFELLTRKINDFLDKETVSEKDRIFFTFKRKTYTAITKVLIITK